MYRYLENVLTTLFARWPVARPGRRYKTNPDVPAEILETRICPSISSLAAVVNADESVSSIDSIVWLDADNRQESSYEVWLEQNVGDGRNPKVYYEAGLNFDGTEISHPVRQQLSLGDYTLYVRRHDLEGTTSWAEYSFQIDNDDDPNTPIEIAPPNRPEITVVREGQGAAGQVASESAIRWIGNSALYDVWLGTRTESGLAVDAVIRNVSGQSISFRELASATGHAGPLYHDELPRAGGPSQLHSGDYQFYVRGVNGAVNSEDQWIGRGPWSARAEFTFHRVEGADAVPTGLQVTNSTRPVVSWNDVPNAESYLISLWRGPDYQNHTPLNVRVYGTEFSVNQHLTRNQDVETFATGAEVYVRVRAIGSEGMMEGFAPGNFAATTIHVPAQISLADYSAPVIFSPKGSIPDSMPVLTWAPSPHAESYDVWFTSVQTGRRMFLASDINAPFLHLTPDTLARTSDLATSGQDEYSAANGLEDGDYRFWVRAKNDISTTDGAWSKSAELTVESDRISALELFDHADASALPLVSPNLVESWSHNGQQFLLVTNGLGESFGASVLARFIPGADGIPYRPVEQDAATGQDRLQFPDLPMGSNVSDMAFFDENRLLVLSRSSNEIRIVDLVNWKVTSSLALSPGAKYGSPDAMDLEILSNGQILIVFNRSNRLRVVGVNDEGQLYEVEVPGSSTEDQGFALSGGRAMQVSAIRNEDDTYTLFLATPTLSGIRIAKYDAANLVLFDVADTTHPTIRTIKRNNFAGPYVGGRIKNVESANGTDYQFYLSTDRNGFLTWINTDSLEFGFFDLVDYLPDVSRDPESSNYRNPDDNSIDPSRIVDIDNRTVAVMSNREQSVLLSLSPDANGRLTVRNSSPLAPGYGGVNMTVESGVKLISSAGGSFGVSEGSHVLNVTDLSYSATGQEWTVGNVIPHILARPADNAISISNDQILLQKSGNHRSVVRFLRGSNRLQESNLPDQYSTNDGRLLRDFGGAAAVFTDDHSDQTFMAFQAESTDAHHTSSYVAVADITDPQNARLHFMHEVNADVRFFRLQLHADRIEIIDRLGAQIVSLFNWRTGASKVKSYDFAQRHGATFGGSRSGQVLTMTDGTTIVLHDTTPDKVFSVFASDDLHSANPVARVHAHNVGQWIYDMRVYDKDRIVAVTWDAKLLILNIRTGVFETVQKLDDVSDPDFDLYGVRGISIDGDILSVMSPGTGRIAEFQLSPFADRTGIRATLLRVVSAPDAVATLLTPEAAWVIESGHVTRIKRN